MHKFFLTKEDRLTEEEIIVFNKEALRHIVKSLRVKVGEQILFSLENMNYIGEAELLTLDEARFKKVSEFKPENESPVAIDLFQCLPKGQKLELIIQKNVELGVRDFYLVESKRCITEFKGKDIDKKLERYKKIAYEAAKQSKRDYISDIKNPVALKNLKDILSNYDLAIVLYEGERENYLNKVLEISGCKESISKIAIIVGPEGGLEPSEVEMLISFGARVVTLGKRILRTETAGMACVSCIQYAIGDFSDVSEG